MNICVFSRQTFWQGVKGGMEIHGKLLSEGMAARGHTVSLITTRHPDGQEFEEKNGVKIHYLKGTVFGARRKGWPRESVKMFSHLHSMNPFDVIWSQSFDAYGITKSLNRYLTIPVIPILQGCIQQEIVTFLRRIQSSMLTPTKMLTSFAGLFFSYFIVQKKLLKASKKILTASREVKNDLNKWFGSVIAAKCITVFNGVNTSHFVPDAAIRDQTRTKYKIKTDEVVLLSLGRLIYEKGHHLALECLKRLKDEGYPVKLLIVGEGEYRLKINQALDRYGLLNDVILTGFIENDDLVGLYNCADIFLLPTLREEGLPYTLIEAMACSKPVIASKIGGNMSVIEDGKNGFYARPGDIGGMTDKIRTLIRHKGLSEKISLAARKTVLRKFSVANMVELTLRQFQSQP